MSAEEDRSQKPLPERVAVLEARVDDHDKKLVLGASRMNERDAAVEKIRIDTEASHERLRVEVSSWVDRSIAENAASNLRVERTLEAHTVDDKQALLAVGAAVEKRRDWLRNVVLATVFFTLTSIGGGIWWAARQQSPDDAAKASSIIQVMQVKQTDVAKDIDEIKGSAKRQEDAQHRLDDKLDTLLIHLAPSPAKVP